MGPRAQSPRPPRAPCARIGVAFSPWETGAPRAPHAGFAEGAGPGGVPARGPGRCASGRAFPGVRGGLLLSRPAWLTAGLARRTSAGCEALPRAGLSVGERGGSVSRPQTSSAPTRRLGADGRGRLFNALQPGRALRENARGPRLPGGRSGGLRPPRDARRPSLRRSPLADGRGGGGDPVRLSALRRGPLPSPREAAAARVYPVPRVPCHVAVRRGP